MGTSRTVQLVVWLAPAIALCAARGDELPPDLLTVAEKSDYKATARYDEVVALMDRPS